MMTIAIDGPAGSGKSTVAKRVAHELGYTLVDTGAIYRSVAYAALQQGIRLDDDDALQALVADLPIQFRFENGVNNVFLNGENVTTQIRTPKVSMAASDVSARPVVRAGLLQLQRDLAGRGGSVLEGRDIGTTVCPQAKLKVFLFAEAQERAKRRFQEMRRQGDEPEFEEVLADVQKRDAQDEGRTTSPLRPAEDAVMLDSTHLSEDQVVAQVIELATQRASA